MRVFLLEAATIYTDPPAPPSPPSGPPRGTYFSRRKLRHPRPPSPAMTWMSTSSTNIYLSIRRGESLAFSLWLLVMETPGTRDTKTGTTDPGLILYRNNRYFAAVLSV